MNTVEDGIPLLSQGHNTLGQSSNHHLWEQKWNLKLAKPKLANNVQVDFIFDYLL